MGRSTANMSWEGDAYADGWGGTTVYSDDRSCEDSYNCNGPDPRGYASYTDEYRRAQSNHSVPYTERLAPSAIREEPCWYDPHSQLRMCAEIDANPDFQDEPESATAKSRKAEEERKAQEKRKAEEKRKRLLDPEERDRAERQREWDMAWELEQQILAKRW